MEITSDIQRFSIMTTLILRGNELGDPSYWENKEILYRRKSLVFAGRILDETQRIWEQWKTHSVDQTPIDIKYKNLIDLWFFTLAASLISNAGDSRRTVEKLVEQKNTSYSLVESVEQLMKSLLNNAIDFHSLNQLTKHIIDDTSELYVSFSAYLALSRFREEQGFMGIGGGNYVHDYPPLGWNDQNYVFQNVANFSSRSPDLYTTILMDLSEKYKQVHSQIRHHILTSMQGK